MRTAIATVFLLATSLPVAALADCGSGPDRADERAALHTALLDAKTESEARRLSDALWAIWTQAPDDHAQALLDRGMERRQAWDLAESERVLDELVAYCPDYAEGFNQRAFTRFLRERYDEALTDIDSALRRNPYHFGALSGKALTLIRQGRTDLAQEALKAAVALHPFLQERHLIQTPTDKDI